MAEQETGNGKEEKKSEPTPRVVLAGFELPASKVADLLIEAGYGQTPESVVAKPGDSPKLRQQILKALGVEDEKSTVEAFVEVGTVQNSDKRKGIEGYVGPRTLGLYRAPSVSAWKGLLEKKPPKEIAPDANFRD